MVHYGSIEINIIVRHRDIKKSLGNNFFVIIYFDKNKMLWTGRTGSYNLFIVGSIRDGNKEKKINKKY